MTKKAKQLLSGLVLLLLTAYSTWAGEKRDTLVLDVFFKTGMRSFDPAYRENGAHLSSFVGLVNNQITQNSSEPVLVHIRTGASPEGSTRGNEELSLSRAEFLRGYLSDVLSLTDDSFVIQSVGEDWENLYNAVKNMDYPWCGEALNIIQNTPIWVKDSNGVIVDSRKNQLKKLSDGEAWQIFRETAFVNDCAKATVTALVPSGGAVPDTFGRSSHATAPIPTPIRKWSSSRRLADYFQWTRQGRESETALEIQFRLDRTDIDLDYAGNRDRLSAFVHEFHKSFSGVPARDIQIDIYAGASPEGPADHNRDLGEGRCNSIRLLILDALGTEISDIITHNLESRWSDFYDAVAASDEAWKDEVLAIIGMKASDDGTVRDHRELKLRELKGGSVWPQLLSRYLAPLRSGGSAVVSLKQDADTHSVPKRVFPPVDYAPVKDTIFLIEDTALARKHCVPIPLRRSLGEGCPTRIALSPEYLSKLSAVMRDTLMIRFRLDSTRIDPDFAGNRYRIQRFLESVANRFEGMDPSAMRLDIYAGASPEGTAEHNQWLGQERGASIKRLIRDSLGIKVSNIQVHNQAARWDDFYDAVAASGEPWKKEVLSIIREEPSRDPKTRDHREMELRALHGGQVWPVLLDRYLAPLRSGGSAVMSINPQYISGIMGQGGGNTPCGDNGWQFAGDTLWICGGAQATQPAQKDTVVVMQNTPYGMYPYDNYPWDNLPEGYYFDSNGFLRKKQVKKVLVPADKTPAWAVKTNLLFWGVVAPNVSVEIPLGWRNRWALEWEYDHPWFIWSQNSHASQILNMSLELRLYLGNRDYHRWLDGWHIGLAFGGGKYDWEWKQHEGWQGEFINPYFNFGYQHRWGRHWAVDAGMGIGVIPSRYRHYYGGSVYPDNHLEPWDIHLIYHDKGHFMYPGITHINVSISYMFNNWPFLMHNMSEKKRQQWSETYSERTQKEREARYQREKARTERANARDEAKEQRKAAKQAAKQAKKAK